MLEQAVIQKDSELRAAAASQREAGEALRRSGARAQKLEQAVAALQARCLELQRAQSAAEEQQSDALLQLRQQVGPSAKAAPSSLVFFWEVRSLIYMKSWSGTWRRCRRAQAYSCSTICGRGAAVQRSPTAAAACGALQPRLASTSSFHRHCLLRSCWHFCGHAPAAENCRLVLFSLQSRNSCTNLQAAEEAEAAADLLQKAEAALEEVARAEAAASDIGGADTVNLFNIS